MKRSLNTGLYLLILFSLILSSCEQDDKTKVINLVVGFDDLILNMRENNHAQDSTKYESLANDYMNEYVALKANMTDQDQKHILKNAYSYVYLRYGIKGMNMLEDTSNQTMKLIIDETYALFEQKGLDFQSFILELYDENKTLLDEIQQKQLDSIEHGLEHGHHGHNH